MNNATLSNAVRFITLFVAPAILAGCTGSGVVDPLGGVAIADLDTASATSWCEASFEPPWKQAPQPDGPVGSDGTVENMYQGPPGSETMPGDNYAGSLVWSSYCIIQLPVDQCAANLKARPCEATLEQLDECLQAIWDLTTSVDPETAGVSRAPCDTYNAIPGCANTIVGTALPSDGFTSPFCKLPVR